MQIPNFPIGPDQEDKTPHGSDEFPFALYESKLSRNASHRADWHWHSEMQLCLVKSGAVYVCLSDKKLELKAGEGCFINSGMLHMIAPVEDPDSTYYCIDFLPALLSLFPGSIFEKRYIDPYVGNVSEWIRSEMSKSFLGGYNFRVIHNGINTNVFKICNENDVIEKYGLKGKHILLGVASIWSREKGFDDFLQLSRMHNNDEVIVLVGIKNEERNFRTI